MPDEANGPRRASVRESEDEPQPKAEMRADVVWDICVVEEGGSGSQRAGGGAGGRLIGLAGAHDPEELMRGHIL